MFIGACGDVGKFSSSAKTPLERFLSGSEFQRGINTQDRIDKREYVYFCWRSAFTIKNGEMWLLARNLEGCQTNGYMLK